MRQSGKMSWLPGCPVAVMCDERRPVPVASSEDPGNTVVDDDSREEKREDGN